MESYTLRCLSRACPGMVLTFALLRGVIKETIWLIKFKDGLDGRELACQRTGLSSK